MPTNKLSMRSLFCIHWCNKARKQRDVRYIIKESIKSGPRGHIYIAWDTLGYKEVVVKRCRLSGTELWNLITASVCDSNLIQTLENNYLVDDRDIDFSADRNTKPHSNWSSVILTKNHPILMDPWMCPRMLPIQSDVAAEFIVNYFLPVAELHLKTNLVHCDIKPANYVVSYKNSSRLSLIDFEMAVPSGSSVNKTHGTPLYMSPEVIRTGSATQAADAWSLGIMLWQLLHTEEHPFCIVDKRCGDSVNSMFSALVSLDYNVETMWKCPDSVASDLCSRLLNKDPAHRLDVINALNHPFFKSRDIHIHYTPFNFKNGVLI